MYVMKLKGAHPEAVLLLQSYAFGVQDEMLPRESTVYVIHAVMHPVILAMRHEKDKSKAAAIGFGALGFWLLSTAAIVFDFVDGVLAKHLTLLPCCTLRIAADCHTINKVHAKLLLCITGHRLWSDS
jgi:hypothetical protein